MAMIGCITEIVETAQAKHAHVVRLSSRPWGVRAKATVIATYDLTESYRRGDLVELDCDGGGVEFCIIGRHQAWFLWTLAFTSLLCVMLPLRSVESASSWLISFHQVARILMPLLFCLISLRFYFLLSFAKRKR